MTAPASEHSDRRGAQRIIRGTLALVACGLAVWVVARDQEAIGAAASFPPAMLAAVAGIVAAYESTVGWRLALVGRAAGYRDVNWLVWFRLHVVGKLANAVFPQAGNVYRAITLRRRHGVSITTFVSMTVFTAWLEMTLAVLLTLAAMLIWGRELGVAAEPVIWLLGAMLLALLAGPIMADRLLTRVRLSRGALTWLRDKLHEVAGAVLRWSRDVRRMAALAGLTLLLLAGSAAAHHLGFRGLGIEVSLPVLCLFVVLMKLGSYIVLTPGNLGVRELAYALLGAALDVGAGQAVLVSALIRLATYVVVFPLGLAMGGRELFGHARSDDADPPASTP